MAFPVVMGAMCQCMFGAAPCVLAVNSQQQTVSGAMPLATISDTLMPTFGTCVSTLNPAVASVLSSTGVLVPQPCTPLITGTWLPGSTTVLIGGKPALNQTSKLMCAYGSISITNPMVSTVQVP